RTFSRLIFWIPGRDYHSFWKKGGRRGARRTPRKARGWPTAAVGGKAVDGVRTGPPGPVGRVDTEIRLLGAGDLVGVERELAEEDREVLTVGGDQLGVNGAADAIGDEAGGA